MILKRPDLRNESPWVKVDPISYRIISEGEWDQISKDKTKGHFMTKKLWEQILEERNY
jgi:hypothetical protein